MILLSYALKTALMVKYKKGDMILSAKDEYKGVGISIITAAVKKYGGFMNFESDTDTFNVKLIISIA